MILRQFQRNVRFLCQFSFQHQTIPAKVNDNIVNFAKNSGNFDLKVFSTSSILQKVKGLKPKGLSKEQLNKSISKSDQIQTALINLHKAITSGAKEGDSLYANQLNACKVAGCTPQSITALIERCKKEHPSHIVPITGANEIAFLVICKAPEYAQAVKYVKTAVKQSLGSFQCIESHRIGQIFEKKGKISVSMPEGGEEEATDLAIEIGAEDVEIGEKTAEFTCDAAELSSVLSQLNERSFEIESCDVGHFPLQLAELSETDESPFKFVVTKMKQTSIGAKVTLEQIVTNFEHEHDV